MYRLLVPILGLAILAVAGHYVTSDLNGSALAFLGTILFVGGLFIAGRSVQGAVLLFLALFVVGVFILILGAIPERYGWWQFLLFPGDVGVVDFGDSLLDCVLLLALMALVVLGLRKLKPAPAKSSGH